MADQGTFLEHDPAKRRAFDFYATPAWMTRALIRRVSIAGSVLEPCAGDDSIAHVFRAFRDVGAVVTNDIDPSRTPTFREDVTTDAGWRALPECAWTITNPPFDQANQIVPRAVARLAGAPVSNGVAMLLRLSWLEPTEERAAFLERRPPNHLIIMPRHDFKGRGSTDSVTSAWFVWTRSSSIAPISVVTRKERDELIGCAKREGLGR